jgi:polysaccharide deacetylase family sporulation protein PdaB
MFEGNVRLISMLGVLTLIVIASLTLDYFHILRRPVRISMGIAILAIGAGAVLTLSAVLPNNHFYGPVFAEVQTKQKIVALTFDDGPYSPYTEQILDVLRDRDVQATFFLVGANAAKNPQLVKRIVEEGHQIGNHTYTHVDLLKMDRSEAIAEIDKTNAVLQAETGVMPHLVRPPHGFRDPSIMDVMASRGLNVVEWSVMSKDWTNPGVEKIVERTVDKVQNGSVILLHDGDGIACKADRSQTVAATRKIIDKLQARGYRFVTVDEILQSREVK